MVRSAKAKRSGSGTSVAGGISPTGSPGRSAFGRGKTTGAAELKAMVESGSAGRALAAPRPARKFLRFICQSLRGIFLVDRSLTDFVGRHFNQLFNNTGQQGKYIINLSLGVVASHREAD